MDWDALSAIAEIVAAAGVIASLVYLANQVKSSSDQANQVAAQHRQAAVQSVVNKLNDVYGHLANASSADVWARGSHGMDTLESEAERIQMSSFLMSVFRPYEELFHYRREGIVEDWLWESTSAPCLAIMGSPGFDDWWKLRADWFSAEFREHLMALREQEPRYRRLEPPSGRAS